jgi:hypothetical protein
VRMVPSRFRRIALLTGGGSRKKSRCPGEKPICSHCARLRQTCFYADEAESGIRRSTERESIPLPVSATSANTTTIVRATLDYRDTNQ